MGVVTFTVPGPLWGYRRPRDKDSNYKKYTEFKNFVLETAMRNNWAGRVDSLIDHPPRLSVHVKWKKNPRTDWSNIYKAVEDALFSQDRWVKPGNKSDYEWDCGKEEVIVIIES